MLGHVYRKQHHFEQFPLSHLAQVFVQEFVDMVVQVYLTVLLVLASL